jgi:hypothetical protein
MKMHFKARFILLFVGFAGMVFFRDWMEAGMATHMAVQIPLLAVVGGLFIQLLQQRYPRLAIQGKRYRTSLLLFTLFIFGLWMLPRLLDAALHQTDLAILKWITLPMAGMTLVLCWQHLPFILRGILHLEALATLLRLGWLYLIAPQRYCVSYGMDDQQLLGYVLLFYGAIYSIMLGSKVMFGKYTSQPAV